MSPKHALIALFLASGAAQAQPVTVAKSVPYAADSNATQAVRTECTLPADLPEAIKDAAGDKVTLSDAPGARHLKLEIGHVLGVGGPFTPKSMSVAGQLMEGDKVVGTFHARRQTTGGATCMALKKCASTLGKDIAAWLEAPAMDSKLGNAK